MKKIISIIASLAIAAALIPSAFAHETEAFKITADVTQFTDETFYDYYEENIPEGYDAYMVVLGLEGLADTLSYTKTAGTNAKPKYSGTALDMAEIFFKTSVSNDKFYEDYSYILDGSFSTWPSEGFRTDGVDGWTMNYNGNFVYPGAKDTEITEIPEYMTIGYVVKEGTSVTFTLDDATFALLDYTDSTITSQSNYTSRAGQVTMDPFTLGESDPSPNPGDIKTERTLISGSKYYSEVYDEDTVARVIVEENLGAKTATAESVLVAYYLNNNPKVANIYELLGIDAESKGSVDFDSFTVKMILPVGDAATDNFSFNIQ